MERGQSKKAIPAPMLVVNPPAKSKTADQTSATSVRPNKSGEKRAREAELMVEVDIRKDVRKGNLRPTAGEVKECVPIEVSRHATTGAGSSPAAAGLDTKPNQPCVGFGVQA